MVCGPADAASHLCLTHSRKCQLNGLGLLPTGELTNLADGGCNFWHRFAIQCHQNTGLKLWSS
jgi:hypothetical protein